MRAISQFRSLITLVVGCLVAAGLLLGCSLEQNGRSQTEPTASAEQAPTAQTRSDQIIERAALPVEARRTISLIERGGPFPFDRDGVVFGNYERHLPVRQRGFYREYTVITPGIGSRGPRRIVAGRDGQMYYTADHYNSFRKVIR